MITIGPVRRALVPVDSAAATRMSGPNYDEFQGDHEIWRLLQEKPDNILRVTMAHCDVPAFDQALPEGSAEALQRAGRNMGQMLELDQTRIARDVMWVYEIVDPTRPGVRQIGLGGMARTAEIRTEQSPDGVIIRNEGIHQYKAKGRADLIEHVGAYIGTVNCAVEDRQGALAAEMERVADSRSCDFQATDEQGNVHKVWLIDEGAGLNQLSALLAQEPCAYVADGNHRSAAAAMLGRDEFLAVFFTVDRMGIAPYNRLLGGSGGGDLRPTGQDLLDSLADAFDVRRPGDAADLQPQQVHQIGLYTAGAWHQLEPKPSSFDSENAARVIDADIVQRKIFDQLFGISDPRDPRLRYVGGNKSAAYLREKVDQGEAQLAITLAPVTMRQFVAVCQQNRFMPPKSTWFEPKIRSGLVVAMLD